MDKVVDIYEDIEHRSREVVMQYGGSISHHHGVGKLRKRFIEKSVTDMNQTMQNGIKSALDPKNIFACNNTFYKSAEERKEDLEHTV
jgi:alkyldihydroxyacetonephosphate synthase